MVFILFNIFGHKCLIIHVIVGVQDTQGIVAAILLLAVVIVAVQPPLEVFHPAHVFVLGFLLNSCAP